MVIGKAHRVAFWKKKQTKMYCDPVQADKNNLITLDCHFFTWKFPLQDPLVVLTWIQTVWCATPENQWLYTSLKHWFQLVYPSARKWRKPAWWCHISCLLENQQVWQPLSTCVWCLFQKAEEHNRWVHNTCWATGCCAVLYTGSTQQSVELHVQSIWLTAIRKCG